MQPLPLILAENYESFYLFFAVVWSVLMVLGIAGLFAAWKGRWSCIFYSVAPLWVGAWLLKGGALMPILVFLPMPFLVGFSSLVVWNLRRSRISETEAQPVGKAMLPVTRSEVMFILALVTAVAAIFCQPYAERYEAVFWISLLLGCAHVVLAVYYVIKVRDLSRWVVLAFSVVVIYCLRSYGPMLVDKLIWLLPAS